VPFFYFPDNNFGKFLLYLSYYFEHAACLQVMLIKKKKGEVTTVAHGEKSIIEAKSYLLVPKNNNKKRQCHEKFDLRFFSRINIPPIP
jgi:hypothetical protein